MRTSNVDQTLCSIIQQAQALRELAKAHIKRENSDDDAAFDVLFRIDRDLEDASAAIDKAS